MGNIGTALTAVTIKGESVSCKTIQPRATSTMKKDTIDSSDEPHSSRNCVPLKAPKWACLEHASNPC